ncbi:MAG TPA: hypothetical protein VHF69_13240 [Candidatus Synoicihabitans sp.]|nr:hypothetical protein [Candidatus Synoicihabitans sp.]
MAHDTPVHSWKFHRLGDLDQVALTSGADLLALEHLDQKLWVALSCPVKGLELDEQTLALVDQDQDGRIRVPDIIGSIRWAANRLKDVGELLQGSDRLPLAALDDQQPDGAALLATARDLLARAKAPDATTVSLAEVQAARAAFGQRPLNGDGVITAASTDDPQLHRLIADVLASVGGVPDRSGQTGIDRAKLDAFFAQAEGFITWAQHGTTPRVLTLGDATSAAAAAVGAVRTKIDDYFARTRLAAFDARASALLNAPDAEIASLATKELNGGSSEIAALPLARIEPDRPLPLRQGVNPVWAGALETLHATAVTALFGANHDQLTEAEWHELKNRVAPYEVWQQSKAGAAVEALGVERLQALLAGPERQAAVELMNRDAASAPEADAIAGLEKLTRFRRDFGTLLRNFVNFTDFYSPDRLAIFQAGVLYLDSRSIELCVDVADPGAHAKLAALSQTYLAYCDLKRAGCAPRKIAACLTQGHGDYLRVGRNGIFYDRQGRDWDATITLIIENPISVRQAFWSPYKKVARFVEDQMTKFAAAKEKSADAGLAAGVAATTTAPGGARPAFDVAKFAGIFAAIGLALGAIGGAIASVATGFMNLTWWQMPLAVGGALLLISGPSMLLAALKLRQRTLGPILDANGWAVNGRVHINIPFGTKLTERATLPAGAQRTLDDPYSDTSARRRRRTFIVLIVLLLAGVATARILRTWPFAPAEPTAAATAAPEGP